MLSKTKQPHHYRITIEQLAPGEATSQPIEFELEDREDLFAIVENIKQHSGLEPEQATRVGVALRLLGPVMMQHRKHPLFINFMPHFKQFMQQLKSTIKEAVKP